MSNVILMADLLTEITEFICSVICKNRADGASNCSTAVMDKYMVAELDSGLYPWPSCDCCLS